VDVAAIGYPDLLAGGGWQRDRKMSRPDFFTTRAFDLYGMGRTQQWEWVGPQTALLVWSDSGLPLGKITGRELFGTITWGRAWEDGYEPLATLDKNSDGIVSGPELSTLYLWQDLDSNAVCDPGEVVPASEKLISLSVRPQRASRDAWHDQGAQLLDGRRVPTWDWWSSEYFYPPTSDAAGRLFDAQLAVPSFPTEQVTVYHWEVLESKGFDNTPLGEGGLMRFVLLAGKLCFIGSNSKTFGDSRLLSGTFSLVEQGSSGAYYWSVGNGLTRMEIQKDGVLLGMTKFPDGAYYTWKASLLDFSTLGDSNVYQKSFSAPADVQFQNFDTSLPVYFQPFSGVLDRAYNTSLNTLLLQPEQ